MMQINYYYLYVKIAVMGGVAAVAVDLMIISIISSNSLILILKACLSGQACFVRAVAGVGRAVPGVVRAVVAAVRAFVTVVRAGTNAPKS